MSDTEEKINCEVHGETNATFVCQHLLRGQDLGFNIGFDPDDPDDLCPDAWCNQCDALYDAEGGWTDKAVEFSDIKLLCAGCYETVRDRNWIQDDEVFHELVCDSFSFIDSRHKKFMSDYNIGSYGRYDWDQRTGKLVFSNEGVPKVEAEIQFSGTFSSVSNTWMWAWANTYLEESIKSSSRLVKTLGEELGLKQLVAGRYAADEVDGWEMTSVLAKKLNAIGVYRTSSEDGYTYMVITDAQWIN